MTVTASNSADNSVTSDTQSPFFHKDEVEWRLSSHPISYPDALQFMDDRVAQISKNQASECVWLLEHPPLLTKGTSANQNDLIEPDRFDVFETGRGGQYTYHGPGQRVIYVMLDLNKRAKDVRAFVYALESWMIDTLKLFQIKAQTNHERVGIWVGEHEFEEEKICALGIRLRRWVSFHGLALNVAPDLEHYHAIVPCGILTNGVTSMKKLGKQASMLEVDQALKLSFEKTFGPTKLYDEQQDRIRHAQFSN